MLKKIFFSTILFVNVIFANQDIKKDYLVQFSKRHDINASLQYQSYKKAFYSVLKTYKNNISKTWKNVIISNETLWVKYTNNNKFRTIIDYKNSNIIFEVFAENEKMAHDYVISMFNNLYTYTKKDIYKTSYIRKNTLKELIKSEDITLNDEPYLSDIINTITKKRYLAKLSLDEYNLRLYNEKNIYKIILKLPSNYKIILKNKYENVLNKIANKLDLQKKLLHAIIQSKSNSNVFAVDNNLSYGLMLLSIERAMSMYSNIYHIKKLISPMYLYDIKNNIELSSQYLFTLFNDEFNYINNEKSKLFCVVLAYITNEKIVFDLFGKNKSEAIKEINSLKSSKVYKKMLRDIRDSNTRISLSKIIRHIGI